MRRWGAPLLALLAARLVTAAAALWAGVDPLQSGSWVRFDSYLYLDIARQGYTLLPCPPESKYAAWQWCGNAGWFPLYAWLWPHPLASLLFDAAALLVLWRYLLAEQDGWALGLAALFPGCIYRQAVFPISLFLLCALAYLAALERGRDRLAAPLGALAAMSYSTGFLLAPVALAWRRRLWPALGVCAGVAIVLAVMRIQTGSWSAYRLIQAKYDFHFAPQDALFARLKPLVNPRYRNASTLATAAQTALVLALLAASLASFRRRPLLALYCCAYWLLPLCLGGRISLHRAEGLLMPMVALVSPRARPWLLAAAAPIAFATSVAFFRGTIT